ncbi:MAG: hypothetical protein NTW87_07915 [Planctomycetota bacterium]|nr:hypothetical protein [Planctomycetota bacterium]
MPESPKLWIIVAAAADDGVLSYHQALYSDEATARAAAEGLNLPGRVLVAPVRLDLSEAKEVIAAAPAGVRSVTDTTPSSPAPAVPVSDPRPATPFLDAAANNPWRGD